MIRVAVVLPEPTPYRTPLLDRLAARADLDLAVVYSARTVAGRTWQIDLSHRAQFLRGVRIPGVRRLLRHEYPVTPSIVTALWRARPDVVVVSGWSTFAAQASMLWCRARGVPYVVLSESHDADPRAAWRRSVKRAVVPRALGGAAAFLAAGTLARRSLERLGAPADAIWTFANTVDVDAFARRADELAGDRIALRRRHGVDGDAFVVVCVARLAPEKGIDTLLRAVAQMRAPASVLLVGDGPARADLAWLATDLGVAAHFAGDVDWEAIVEAYVVADVFALLSRHEPWGVVVTEAAACGLPLVLSEHVGAAADLLRDGENGALVPVDDPGAAAAALDALAGDAGRRTTAGVASRRLASGAGYDASVAGFVAAVTHAAR